MLEEEGRGKARPEQLRLGQREGLLGAPHGRIRGPLIAPAPRPPENMGPLFLALIRRCPHPVLGTRTRECEGHPPGAPSPQGPGESNQCSQL